MREFVQWCVKVQHGVFAQKPRSDHGQMGPPLDRSIGCFDWNLAIDWFTI